MASIQRTDIFTGDEPPKANQVETELSSIVEKFNYHDKGTLQWTMLSAKALKLGVTVHTTGDKTCGATDLVVVINKTSGSATAVTLPASPATGRTILIKDGKGDAATNNITIAAASGNIDGVANKVIGAAYGAIEFVYNGTEWNALAPAVAPGTATYLAYYAKAATVSASASGLVTANGNLEVKGTTTNDSATTGYVGEEIRAFQATGSIGMTANAWVDIRAIQLTAGDWDVAGLCNFYINNGGSLTKVGGAISLYSANNTTDHSIGDNVAYSFPPTANTDTNIVIPSYRISTNSTISVYLKAWVNSGATGTPGTYGRISARRSR